MLMASRRYNLGKRAVSVAETRRRILDAAATAYCELGIHTTSIQEIARRADLSPATILNHFPESDVLVDAVIVHIIESLQLPSREIFEGVEDTRARLSLLIDQLYDFYERSEVWVALFFRERSDVPALAKGEARVMKAIGDLLLAALGPLANDEKTRSVAGAAVDPGFRGALVRAGLSEPLAREIATEFVLVWLNNHLTEAREGGS